MSKIAIISDVNAGLDYIGRDPQIPVLRSMINFGEEHYVDGLEIKADQFYEKVKEKIKDSIIPSTSAPTVGEAMELIEKLIEEGYTDVIMYSISFKLSSIGEMVENLKQEYEDQINIHVVDTKTATYMQGFLAVTAKEMVDQGKSVEEILERTKYLIDNSCGYFVVDDLSFLVKNGRLSGAAGFFAGLLKIKPVLIVDDEGYIRTFEKIKTHSKAIERLKELIQEQTKEAKKVLLFVFHTCREDDAKVLKQYFENTLTNVEDVQIHMVTPAVGAHIGCGILGVGYYLLEK